MNTGSAEPSVEARQEPAAATWLGLLAEGEPASELEKLRRRLLRDCAVAGRSTIGAEAAQALQVHAQLAERKKHADELAVLNDLARRLASMRDSKDVLQEIAGQARRLLGVDVAYIMLLRDNRTLHIEVVDGSMGSALRGIQLPAGEGLGGQILVAGVPMWSEDYLQDTSLAHTRLVDSVATSEQLGGILGVPMIIGEETIGVLLAADRTPHSFAEREVALLASLASHAAAAIRNAELFDQHRTAVEELRESNHRLRGINEARQSAIDLHEQLTGLVIRGRGLDEIVATIGQALGSDVAVFGAEDAWLHGTATDPDGDLADLLELTGGSGAAGCFVDPSVLSLRRRLDSDEETILTPVTLRDGYAGCVLARGATMKEDATHLLETGATSVALVVASERAVAEAERRARGDFVNALLAEDSDEETIRRRARSAGIDLDTISSVIVLDHGGSNTQTTAHLVARLTDAGAGWSAEHANQIVALLPFTSADEARTRILSLSAGNVPAAIGIAACNGGTPAVREAYEAARQSATVLLALGRTDGCVLASELGIYRSLFSRAGRNEINTFITGTIGPLIEHDRSRSRSLVRTLSVYMQQANHHAHTCAALHIHANTLYQRLDRVSALIGTRWKDPDYALEVQLALKMHQLTEAIPDAAATS
jgi:DNA-binding PucR family transcriptional regulator